MAAFTGFPATYQPMYYAPQQYQTPVMQNNPQPNNGIIWVQGEAGAKSYLVAPNSTVQLWDSEKQCIYLKSADASGMPSMKILDYTIRDSGNAPVVQTSITYATKADLDAVKEQLDALKSEIKGMNHNEQSAV